MKRGVTLSGKRRPWRLASWVCHAAAVSSGHTLTQFHHPSVITGM